MCFFCDFWRIRSHGMKITIKARHLLGTIFGSLVSKHRGQANPIIFSRFFFVRGIQLDPGNQKRKRKKRLPRLSTRNMHFVWLFQVDGEPNPYVKDWCFTISIHWRMVVLWDTAKMRKGDIPPTKKLSTSIPIGSMGLVYLLTFTINQM